ncbi:DUF3108 domain-containing protein [Chitinibacter sp. GC72]|uniref:DUF3108 domain-containing protein n=1 Tax=Chitinibacter sp. GC72 TaxID=1526917 RepID=UPI0012FB6188|nr:DUF3108 domain-containing protein [Chitinibacter sp. GC72]
MSKYAWWALALSLTLHLVSVLAEPVLNWLSYRQIADPVLKKTARQLASQSLDHLDTPDQLPKVKAVEQQVVFLQPAAVRQAEPATSARSVTKARQRKLAAEAASQVVQEGTPSTDAASAPTAITSSITANDSDGLAASEPVALAAVNVLQSAGIALAAASQASAVKALLGTEKASSVQRASAALAKRIDPTKIDREAAKLFPREVKIEYRYLGFPAYLHWKLEAGRYDLQLDVPIPGHARRFISRGKIDKQGVMPEQFVEYRKQFTTPKFDVRFDWERAEVTLSEGENQKVEPFAAGDQDLMSAALHLALMGGSQPKYEMALFSGRKRYPEVQFELKGEAQLKIGGKEIPALLMSSRTGERQVDFWLAPDWHNLPVRMVLNFGKDGTYDLSAYNLTLDGKKVLEWVNPNTQGQRRP